MSDYENVVWKLKTQLENMGDEIHDMETKVKSAGSSADEWSRDQIVKLKTDWTNARTKIDRLSDEHHREIEASWGQVKSDVENHANALRAAVSAYRAHIEKNHLV